MRIFKFSLVALAVVAVCAVGIAAAHTKYFVSTMTARFTPGPGGFGSYSGKVLSPKAACRAKRKIVITDRQDQVLSTGTSDSQGNFSLPGGRPPAGTIEAEAKQKRIAPKTRAHKHYCLRAKTHVLVHR
jgi:hypothetical protein